MYRLFDEFANEYDLHTPPDHYRHDHAHVIERAASLCSQCRLLDVGCGTGVLLEKARRAGLLATGIDASEGMIRVAEQRLGHGVVQLRRMQDIDTDTEYDFIVSLSWTINYCSSRTELLDVLQRLYRSLRPGGHILLQVAHAPHFDEQMMEDKERGPGCEVDVILRYRFVRLEGEEFPMRAEYYFECSSLKKKVSEQHFLRMADANEIAKCAREVGFVYINLYDSWRCDPFKRSASPLVFGVKMP